MDYLKKKKKKFVHVELPQC